ncbi:protein kinase [Escherichia phage vB_Ec_Tarrare]|uniref:Protein kinase n=1 Tax=Escherichia phage vB_Ec_Tarrare TaxID=3032379 RepID=A0AAF0IC24_9CAUD|nr:protein kinase [Escherichia phage vB_Ec_Tarrare]
MNPMTISARVATIQNLPICELDKRQGLLVALAADIVNHETENGKLTQAEGNNALESMPYWTTLNEYMRGAGFIKLGNGHFSAAYRHHLLPQKVIKVGFKKEDSGAAYAAFCRMHQGKQGIPTIHDIQRHAGCYTVVLDELEALPQDYWGDVDDNHEVYEQFDMVRDVINYEESRECFGSELMEDLYTTAKSIRKFFEGIARFDMHSGNAMMDKHGNLVITDPVSFSADDALPQEDFMVDPDELLKEIELIAERRMIERCKARKAKRDPNGEFRRGLKVRAKRKKAADKWVKHLENEMRKRRLDDKAERRVEKRARQWFGTSIWQAQWLNNLVGDFKVIEERAAAAMMVHDAVAIQAGQALHVDKILDDMFQG